MKNWILATLGALIAISASSAQAQSQATGCRMDFNVDFHVLLVYGWGDGFGTVTCQGADGRWSQAPVRIKVDGLGVATPGIFQYIGTTGQIGIQDPRDLFGDYTVIDAALGVGGAVRATLGFENTSTGMTFGGSLSGGVGIGASLMGTNWEIRPSGPPRFLAPQQIPRPPVVQPVPCPQPQHRQLPQGDAYDDEVIGEVQGPAGE